MNSYIISLNELMMLLKSLLKSLEYNKIHTLNILNIKITWSQTSSKSKCSFRKLRIKVNKIYQQQREKNKFN